MLNKKLFGLILISLLISFLAVSFVCADRWDNRTEHWNDRALENWENNHNLDNENYTLTKNANENVLYTGANNQTLDLEVYWWNGLQYQLMQNYDNFFILDDGTHVDTYEEAENESEINFGFDFGNFPHTENIKFVMTSSEILYDDEDLTLGFIEDVVWYNFTEWQEYAEYQVQEFSFESMRDKNLNATFELTQPDNYTYELVVIGATDFDPQVQDVFTSDFGGTYVSMEWDSTKKAIRPSADVLYAIKGDVNSTKIYDYSHNTYLSDNDGATYVNYGRNNGAYWFDGSKSFINVTDLKAGNSDLSADFTILAWVNVTSFPGTANLPIFSKTVPGAFTPGDKQFYFSDDGKLNFMVGSGLSIDTLATISAQEWVHVGAVYNSVTENFTFYINGIKDNSTNSLFPADNTSSQFLIGQTANSDYFPGIIDDFYFFTDVKTDAEILSIYNGTNNATNYVPDYTKVGNEAYVSNVLESGVDDIKWLNMTIYGLVGTSNLPLRNLDLDNLNFSLTCDTADTTELVMSRPATASDLTSSYYGVNGSYWFDGIGNKLIYDSNLTSMQPFTLSFWIKQTTNTQSASAGFFSSANTLGADTFEIGMGTSGGCAGKYSVKGNETDGTPFEICYTTNDLTWNHIALTYDGTTFKTYQNGFEIASGTKTMSSAISIFKFGTNRQSDTGFEGFIDEIRYYQNEAMTLPEIKEDMRKGTGVKTTIAIKSSLDNKTFSGFHSFTFDSLATGRGDISRNLPGGNFSQYRVIVDYFSSNIVPYITQVDVGYYNKATYTDVTKTDASTGNSVIYQNDILDYYPEAELLGAITFTPTGISVDTESYPALNNRLFINWTNPTSLETPILLHNNRQIQSQAVTQEGNSYLANVSGASTWEFVESNFSNGTFVNTTNCDEGLRLDVMTIGHFHLDIDETNPIDSSTINSSTIGDAPAFVSKGRFGGAYEFTAGTDIDINNVVDYNFGTDDFSISAWIKSNDSTDQQYIFSKGGTSQEGYALSINNGLFSSNIYGAGGSDQDCNATTTIENNTWYHLVAVFDRDNVLRMYVNNANETDCTYSANNNESIDNVLTPNIGSYSDGTTLPFNGTIDEIQVFNMALNDLQIGTLYNATQPAQYYDTTTSLTDGDMELPTNASWIVGNDATLTKEAGARTGGDGTLIFRIADNGSLNVPNAQQTILTSGTTYQVTGWARGDGTAIPGVWAGAFKWLGTSSATWQEFNETFVSTSTSFRLYGTSSVNNYVEFDDVELIRLTQPVFYLDFEDETGTTVTDKSSYGISCVGTVDNFNYSSKFENGLAMNGVSGIGYLCPADDPQLQIDADDRFTLMAWYKAYDVAPGTASTLIAKRDSAPYWQIRINYGGNWVFYFHNGTNAGNTPANDVGLDDYTWRHMAVTKEDTSIKWYMDGVLVRNTALAVGGTWDNSANNLTIGGYDTGTAYAFNGSIDDLRVYNSTFDINQIQLIYNSSVENFYPEQDGGTYEAQVLDSGEVNPSYVMAWQGFIQPTSDNITQMECRAGNSSDLSGETYAVNSTPVSDYYNFTTLDGRYVQYKLILTGDGLSYTPYSNVTMSLMTNVARPVAPAGAGGGGGGGEGLMECPEGQYLGIDNYCYAEEEEEEISEYITGVWNWLANLGVTFLQALGIIPENSTITVSEEQIRETVNKITETMQEAKTSVNFWIFIGLLLGGLLLVHYGYVPYWAMLIIPVLYWIITKFV